MNDWPRTDPDGIQYFEKAPDTSVAEFGVDWTDWLIEPGNGTVIATSAWTVPTGITNISDDNDTTKATIRVSGGTVGTNYDLVNTITTVSGLIEPRTIRIKCVPKISR